MLSKPICTKEFTRKKIVIPARETNFFVWLIITEHHFAKIDNVGLLFSKKRNITNSPVWIKKMSNYLLLFFGFFFSCLDNNEDEYVQFTCLGFYFLKYVGRKEKKLLMMKKC